MELWQQVINTAMLGTDKGSLGADAFPDDLKEVGQQLMEYDIADKEARFLNQASVAFNYRQSGYVPFSQTGIEKQTAQPEEKLACSPLAYQALNDVLDINNISLLTLWLNSCIEKNWIVPPDILTILLDKAVQQPALRPQIVACSGNRGLWLGGLNPQWDFFKVTPDEEIWQTGKPEERVKVLQRLRGSDPAKAAEWLQQTWAQENAAAKTDLLKTLSVNLSAADLPWLESLLGEKSQKVKDEVIGLLKQLPGSSIVKQFEAILREAVTLKKEKAFLGLKTKISIEMKLPKKFDQNIYKLGINRLSGPPQEKVTEESYTIYQLMEFVPPSFWIGQFDATNAAQVVEYFDLHANEFVGALGFAVTRFHENDWMPYFLSQENKFYLDFLEKLPVQSRDAYLLRLYKNGLSDAVHYCLQCKREWGNELALSMVLEMAADPYKYNRSTYDQHIALFPVSIISALQNIDSKNTNVQSTWVKTRAHLTTLLTLKQKIQQAFNQ